MKNRKSIGEQGFGHYKSSGVYDEEDDGSHRCVTCNKKMRTGQKAISTTTPNSHGYRRHDTYYYHVMCPDPT